MLTSEEFQFGEYLEKSALKRSGNTEVYQAILKVFTAGLTEEQFIERNQQHFLKDSYEMLVLDTKMLQIKNNALKKKWREMKDHPKKDQV